MVRRYRKGRRLTQEQLAELADIDQSTVSQVELDKGDRTVRIVTNLALVFDQEPLDWLAKAGVVALPEEAPPAARAVVPRDSDRLTVAQMVAQVEAWPGEDFQRRRAATEARLSVEAYQLWCVDLFRMWEGNSLMVFDLTERYS